MKVEVLDYGMVKGNTNLDFIDRIPKVIRELLAIAKENNIEDVVIEDIQCQRRYNARTKKSEFVNIDTFKKLAQLQGALYVVFMENDIRVRIVHSQTWKSSMDIKGKARTEQKRNAQMKVRTLYNLKVNQDISDSICMGTAFIKTNLFRGKIMSIDQSGTNSGWCILKGE